MKQALPDYIYQHENLRQILMAQEGGIMKYLVTHMDANGTAKLFSDYQDLCVEEFFEANKWDLRVVWSGDKMKRAALGFEHLFKEVQYQAAVMDAMTNLPAEISEIVEDFTEQYLTYAYRQDRQRRHPYGMTPTEIYQEIIEQYKLGGLHYECLELILNEHHLKSEVEKTTKDMWKEFSIRQWSKLLTLNINGKMRQAVANMLEGKTNEQCRRMAIDMMEKVRGFSQMIYTDVVVQSLRNKRFLNEADQRECDGEWLRYVSEHTILEEYSAHVKRHSLRYYFADFVNLLQNIGRIWAAQLLVHGIDMHELEEQKCCILTRSDNHAYYIDRFYSNDMPINYCISNKEQAEELLAKIKNKTNSDNTKTDEKRRNSSPVSATCTIQRKTGAKETKFVDYIINNAETSKVVNIIKRKIYKKNPKQTAYVIIGGIEAGKIRRDVSSPSIEKEFGVKGGSVKPYLTKYRKYKDGIIKSFSEEEIKPYKDFFVEK